MVHLKPRKIDKSGIPQKTTAKKLAKSGVATKRVAVDVRAEVERELAVLRSPGASKKLRVAFAATPDKLAAVANAAQTRRKR